MGIVMRVVVAVAIVAAVLGVAFLVLSNTSTFQITSIDAVASDHVSADDIQKLAKVEEGTTLLNVDTNAITQNLMKNPWVESVSVEREFPDKLKISVTERTVEAVVVMSSRSVAWYLGEGEVWLEPVNLDVSDEQSADDVALEKATSVGAILITGVPATVDPVAGSKATDEVIAAVRSYLDGFSSDFASQICEFHGAERGKHLVCPFERGRGLPGFAYGHLVQGGGREEPACRVPRRAHLHQRARTLEPLIQKD